MEKLFQDILTMDGVQGLVLLSNDGEIQYESHGQGRFNLDKSTLSWKIIIEKFGQSQEMDLVYDGGRYYMRKTDNGFLLISMRLDVSIAMVKLNCDIVIPELKKAKTSKGLKRFFKF